MPSFLHPSDCLHFCRTCLKCLIFLNAEVAEVHQSKQRIENQILISLLSLLDLCYSDDLRNSLIPSPNTFSSL
jgi:hypothetical protein